MTTLQKAEAAEHELSQELDRVVVKSVLYTSGERDPRVPVPRPPDQGKLYLMGHDPRLPRMPDKPTLFDFFRLRFGPSTHLLQSARLAEKNGASEKITQEAHRYARDHKWYMTSRLITVNDLYAFDPGVQVELEEFTDIVGRNFKQPKEGLGFDGSPSAHMWRTINWPTRYL